MGLNDVISQLENIRANSASFLDAEEPNSVWQEDIEALDETLAILRRMEQQSWWRRFLFRIRYMFASRFR